MFQIFDCNGRPVGRPEGYKKHETAQALAERRGRIKTAIWTAYHSQENLGELGRRLVYRIEWVEPRVMTWTGQPLRLFIPGLIPLN
jgi:hypothetical protein